MRSMPWEEKQRKAHSREEEEEVGLRDEFRLQPELATMRGVCPMVYWGRSKEPVSRAVERQSSEERRVKRLNSQPHKQARKLA